MTPGQLDPEARRRVNEIFDRALDLASGERAAFVQRESADASVRDEVLSLLAWHDHTDQFLAEPVRAVVSREASRSNAERLIDTMVGQYHIDRILGEGGMGVVYQAEDLRLGRLVALKAVSSAVTRDPARRERLRREARAAAALTHPGIATVYALEEFGDDLFIAGEFVAGETLRDEVARGPAESGLVLDTAIELAQALCAAHDRGVIHRDLKPENVIRTPSGHVKILDFGLATVRDLPPDLARLTGDGTLLGTPGYMSPEQIRRDSLDGRADLFSLGIVLFELQAGAHPFGSGDAATMIARILSTEPAPLSGGSTGSRASGSVRRGLDAIIRTLLQKAPAARFASAHELLAALERVRAGETFLESGPGPVAAQALGWWKFHQVTTIVFYAALLIPTWWARHKLGDGGIGLPLFLIAMVAVVAASTLRLHLWFAAASMPGQWARQHASSWIWLRAADLLLVATLVVIGLEALTPTSSIAVLLVTSSVLVLVSATIIEPATTRAAFGPAPQSGPGR